MKIAVRLNAINFIARKNKYVAYWDLSHFEKTL